MRIKDLPAEAQKAYRKLRKNAVTLHRVLTFSGTTQDWTLELVHFSDLNNADYMAGKTILFTPN
jgi:hypothetical protein